MKHPGNENLIVRPDLEGEPFYWPGSRHKDTGILMIHGLTATTAEVRPISKFLHANGYTVSGPLLPGHYTTIEDLNRVHWQDWVATVEAAYTKLASDCSRVIVGGESTGALLALWLAINHPEIAGILLYAPALRLTLSPFMIASLYLVSPFVSFVPRKESESDRDMPWQGYSGNGPKGVIQLLKLQKVVAPCLEKVQQPILIIQGRQDNTVHPDVPEQIFTQVSSSIKERHWMEDSTHCVILDRELEQVCTITQRFIDRIFVEETTASGAKSR